MASRERVAVVVVGAGVVGLACARALARRGLEVVVLEGHDRFGTETSARNSEVMHAGIYYPQGSLKAQLCVRGRRQLAEFCEQYGVTHRLCGKLIVATSAEQEPALAKLSDAARANGVDDLRWLTAAEVKAMEPALRCTSALLSPSTGIIDSHGLMLALLGDAEKHGAVLAVNSPVVGGEAADNGIELHVGGAAPTVLAAELVVNAAGLSAQVLASTLQGYRSDCVPPTHYAKGNYYALSGRSPFSRLVYPIPEPGGLGVHLTLDLGGQARFGPDVEWIQAIDYSVDPARADRFYGEIRKYWPALQDGALQPAYAGIRPKLTGPGEAAADFVIQGPCAHGVPGLVNLFGIESPGLTSCLAIADRVCAELDLDSMSLPQSSTSASPH